jgi:Domain of unknown function (DUF5668)
MVNVEAAMTLDQSPTSRAGLVLGAVLAALGVIMLVDRTDLLQVDGLGRLWPVILISLGLTHFLGPHADIAHGVWLVLTGTWLLIVTLTPLAFRDTWPMLLVFFGSMTIVRAFPSRSRARSKDSEGEIDVR